jgi:hypothetical protein
MKSPLLVTHQDVSDLGIVCQLIVEMDDGASRQAEYDFDSFAKETLKYDLCPFLFLQSHPPG